MGIVYLGNLSTVTTAVGGTIPMTTIIRRHFSNIGTSVNLTGTGYYLVNVTATATSSTAGNIELVLQQNDTIVTGANATATVAADGTATLSFSAVVRNNCCNPVSSLVLVNSGVAATYTNVTMVIENA